MKLKKPKKSRAKMEYESPKTIINQKDV